MNLTFIPPTIIEGEKVFEILLEGIAREEAKWKSVIVVYVIGAIPSTGAME